MSLITSPVLNIYQDHAQVLLDKVNVANSLNLLLDDFQVGNPSIFVPSQPGSKQNTKVTFTPKSSSSFYNDFSFYYERMDISKILNNLTISIPRESATMFSDVVPAINAAFGINLLPTDYTDQALPAIDPLDPDAPVDVDIQIKNTSLMFYGAYTLTLNRLVVEPTPYDPEPADLFMVIDQPGESVMKSNIKVVSSSGDPVTAFQFMRNATTKTLVKIDKVLQLKNNHVACLGEFDFHLLLAGNDTQIQTNCMVLTPQGTIVRSATPGSFDFGFQADPTTEYFNRPGSDYIYGLSAGVIKRFGQDGSTLVFNTPVFDFSPAFLKEDLDGKLYVVSPVYTAQVDNDNNPNTPTVPRQQSSVFRLLTTGGIDNLFDPIHIHHTGLATPWAIGSLGLIERLSDIPNTPPVMEAQGFYLNLVPLIAPSSLDDCPVINNVPVVPLNTTVEYGYVPVFRFLQAGTWDNTFVVKQARHKPEAVYNPVDTALAAGRQALAVQDRDVVFFTNRKNPMTDHLHGLPVRYNATGEFQPIGGEYYFTAYRWSDAADILRLKNADMIVFGHAYVALPDGTYSNEQRAVMVSYNASTVPDSVLYYSTDLNGQATSIQSVFAVQN